MLAFFATALHGVTVAITWARDLPNRIVIDESAVSLAASSFVTESYHHVLRDADATTQSDVIQNQLIPYAEGNTDAAAWIRDEYGDDLRGLASSDDSTVSLPASELLALINPETAVSETPDGG